MNELSRHIECLLLKHDCVIVPELGGFIAQYVPARRVEEENLFLPPYRSVGFNQQLCVNDGLLVQSYMQAYDTNYPESIRIIENAVRRLKDTLENEGKYEFEGIGTLSMNIDGSYNFSPCQAGVLSPDLYGLDSLLVQHHHTQNQESQAPDTANPTKKKKRFNVKRTERDYTISINREIVYYAASAVVALFFYFLWATPVQNTKSADLQTASMVYNMLFEQPEETIAKPQQPIATPTEDKQQASLPDKQEAAKAETTAKAVTPNNSKAANAQPTSYSLVLASAIPTRNANDLTEKLYKQGYRETKVYKEGKIVRVIFGNYDTRDAAQKALHRMRKNKAFSDAWIIQTK